MSGTTPTPYVMSLTAAEVETLLLSVYNKIDVEAIRVSLINASDETIPTTKAVADALAVINGDMSSLGNIAVLNSLDLGSDYASGILSVTKGGTGASTPAGARNALGVLSVAETETLIGEMIPDAQAIDLGSTQATGVLPVTKGGTGGSTPVAARAGIGVLSAEESETLVEDKTRLMLSRLASEAGFNLVAGSFEEGGALVNPEDVLWYRGDGKYYSWFNKTAKTVAVGSNPMTTGGIGAGAWVDRTQDALRSDLLSLSGAGIVGFGHSEVYSAATAGYRLKNTVYATDSPFNAPTSGSDATDSINAALTYCAANNKDLILDHMFDVVGTVTIPSNVSVICLTRQCGINSTAVGANTAVSIAGVNSKFIGGTIKGINNPASATIRQDGVFMTNTSSFCELVDVHVYGFFAKGFTGAGAGVGVSDRGVSNKIKNCRVIDSKFCISLGGEKGEVVGNYISNHFLTQTTESKPWTSASNFWDGIVSEGIEDYLIAFNTVTECGQSGIYTGGNGGLSKSNRIIGNLVDKCWNRGIDQGVNAAQSASNDVIGQNIVGNVCRNNRENNIWLAGTTRCNVAGNSSIYDAEYATLFTGYYGGHTGIALTNGAVGTVPHGNSITGNNCYDSELYSNISISCGATATGNTVDGNTTPQGIFLADNGLYKANNFDFVKNPTFTPSLIGGAGTISLSSASGTTNIRNKRLSYSIDITVESVSSPSGHLAIGYIPGLSGSVVRFVDVNVSNYDGIDEGIGNSKLVAYISSATPDQVYIARVYNGVRYFDVRSFLKAGSTLTVYGEVELNS